MQVSATLSYRSGDQKTPNLDALIRSVTRKVVASGWAAPVLNLSGPKPESNLDDRPVWTGTAEVDEELGKNVALFFYLVYKTPKAWLTLSTVPASD